MGGILLDPKLCSKSRKGWHRCLGLHKGCLVSLSIRSAKYELLGFVANLRDPRRFIGRLRRATPTARRVSSDKPVLLPILSFQSVL